MHKYSRLAKQDKLCSPSIILFTYWVLQGINRGAADEFFDGVFGEVFVRKGDPRFELAKFLGKKHEAKRDSLAMEGYSTIIPAIFKAWNMCREVKSVNALFMFKDGERIQEPI